MKLRIVGVAAIVGLTLAGCLGGQPDASGLSRDSAPAALPVGTYPIPVDCTTALLTCHEPTATFSSDGTLLVSTSPGHEFYRIGFAGEIGKASAPFDAAGYDTLLQRAPDGLAWVSKLSEGGVLVSREESGSWSAAMSFVAPSPPWSVDRQWLLFTGPTSGWMVYNKVCSVQAVPCGSELWATPFTNGSFGTPLRMAGLDSRMAFGPSGQPVLDGEGRVWAPLVCDLAPQAALPLAENALSARTACAAVLNGAAGVLENVHDAGPGDGVNLFFPSMVLDGGVPVMTWAQRSGGIYTSSRAMGGWSEPRELSDAQGARLPWALQTPAGLVVLWYQPVGDDRRTLDVMMSLGGGEPIVVGGPVHLGPGAAIEPFQDFPTTDFAYAAASATRLAVPWYDRATGLHVSIVALPA